MAKIHVNPKTGEPSSCRAKDDGCPFGAEDAHFESKDDARAVVEELYDAFDRYYMPTEEKDGKFALELYQQYLDDVKYDDFSRAQAGTVAKFKAESLGVRVTESSRYDAEIHFEAEPDSHTPKLLITTKRNRVSYSIYADDKLVFESETTDVVSGKQMAEYVEEAVGQVDELFEDGDFEKQSSTS